VNLSAAAIDAEYMEFRSAQILARARRQVSQRVQALVQAGRDRRRRYADFRLRTRCQELARAAWPD
jgi:hypothetical protein